MPQRVTELEAKRRIPQGEPLAPQQIRDQVTHLDKIEMMGGARGFVGDQFGVQSGGVTLLKQRIF